MILSALRLLRSLSVYHYRTIIIATLLPAIGPTAIAYFLPTALVLKVVLSVCAFLLWSVLAVLVLASMLRRDRSEAEQEVAQQVEVLSEQISKLKEDHEDLKLDLRQQVRDLEEWAESTFAQMGVVPPPMRRSVRAKGAFYSFDVPAANVTVGGGSRVARLRRWFRRVTRRLREVVYGKPEKS